ncbi:protein-disulfide reductase DsbD family protein [Vulcaniibacterium tengchongense]|uniref:protein-disulfide reductase DsbD family protein n=1 Tax=Vulcaniibacterium tengchongense TaxID=1273429 RepID=UPI001F551726|nr:thioredoxin family protein [Vulcaniibacterium tengchongense]
MTGEALAQEGYDARAGTASMEAGYARLRQIPAMTGAVALLLSSGAASAATGTSQAAAVPGGFAAILALAVLGGLVLNLMPCVLPVLSLKVLSLLDAGTSRAHARRHALWYTAGVMVSFAAIGMVIVALQSGGAVIGWGFQLQQPGFVAALALIMVLIGLSMAGLFTLGGGMGRSGQKLLSKTGAAGDFWSGALACVVASPCVAPFMGPALAYAFTASPAAALLVFLALGLGLSLPFLLVGFVPRLARLLPKPGAWMDTLKVVLAYPMLLTAVWLAWLLGKQKGADAVGVVLAAAVILSFGLWLFEQGRWRSQRWRQGLGALVVCASALSVGVVHRMPAAAKDGTRPSQMQGATAYSARDLAQARKEGRNVLVAVTADWCITCIANEQTVLGTSEFRDLLRRTQTLYMKGDWTNDDPKVGEFLRQHQAPGVPLYVLYRGMAEGVVLPQVLTPDIVRSELEGAHRGVGAGRGPE